MQVNAPRDHTKSTRPHHLKKPLPLEEQGAVWKDIGDRLEAAMGVALGVYFRKEDLPRGVWEAAIQSVRTVAIDRVAILLNITRPLPRRRKLGRVLGCSDE